MDIFYPDYETFSDLYQTQSSQIVWTRIINDLETPVGAYLKLGKDSPYSCLYESVEGGTTWGRYSIIALAPDLVWRVFGDRAEITLAKDISIETDILPHIDRAYGPWIKDPLPVIESLQNLVAASKIDLPKDLPPMIAGLFGVLGYDMVRLIEPLAEAKKDPRNLPDAILTRPLITAVFDNLTKDILLATPVRHHMARHSTSETAYEAAITRLRQTAMKLSMPLHPPKLPQRPKMSRTLNSFVDRTEYKKRVERAKAYIAAGDIFQVVPSHRFEAGFSEEPFSFYRALRRINPSPYLFYFNFGDFQMAGSSPEIMVRLRDDKVTLRPIAGTRPRGKTPAEDLAFEVALRKDPKEIAEHLMLLDLGRNDLGRAVLAKSDHNLGLVHENAGEHPAKQTSEHFPEVTVTESFIVERYSHVMHIVSNIEARLSTHTNPVEVLFSTLPAGTLSGAPKVRAMQIIDELETEKRGLGYGGAAGYISADGSMDTCIVLRTALFQDNRIYVQAGGGVVADSDPDAEYEETLHKSQALNLALEESWRFRS